MAPGVRAARRRGARVVPRVKARWAARWGRSAVVKVWECRSLVRTLWYQRVFRGVHSVEGR